MHTPTRRRFLQFAAAGITTASHRAATPRADTPSQLPSNDSAADLVAILNDTHIGEAHASSHAHPSNLRGAVEHLLAMRKRPAAIIINGDLAFKVGKSGDYSNFSKLIAPLGQAGLAVHLTLGNHDNREEFLRAFPDVRSDSRLKDHRHNSIVDLPNVRLVLLDTLKDVPAAPGRLGDEQIDWLLKDACVSPQRPVVIVAHHNLCIGGDPVHFPGGVEDTDAFWPELVKRPQVKGYIHGHIHDWNLAVHSGIHIINTLASAMVANKAVSTNGWTMARFHPTGIELEVHTYISDHPWSGERKWLYWRQPKQG